MSDIETFKGTHRGTFSLGLLITHSAIPGPAADAVTVTKHVRSDLQILLKITSFIVLTAKSTRETSHAKHFTVIRRGLLSDLVDGV